MSPSLASLAAAKAIMADRPFAPRVNRVARRLPTARYAI